jgi:hypothetical protein
VIHPTRAIQVITILLLLLLHHCISLIKKTSGKSTSAIDATICINKAVSCSGNNDADHISKDVLKSAWTNENKCTNTLYKPYVKIHILMKFQITCNVLLFIS